MLCVCRFLSICGPLKYSEIRLNLTQAVHEAGSMATPSLGVLSVLQKHQRYGRWAAASTIVQWVYLGVACFVVVLAASHHLRFRHDVPAHQAAVNAPRLPAALLRIRHRRHEHHRLEVHRRTDVRLCVRLGVLRDQSSPSVLAVWDVM